MTTVARDKFDPVKFLTPETYFCKRGYQGNYPITMSCAIEFPHKFETYENRICHGTLAYSTTTFGMTGIFTTLWVAKEEQYEASLAYWNFILSPELSPWRALFKVEDGREAYMIRDDLGRPIGCYVPVDDNTSSQLFVNFLIATRMTIDNPQNIKVFKWMLDNGFDVHEAYLGSIHMKFHGARLVRTGMVTHYPFHVNSAVTLDMLRKGTVTLNEHKIKKGNSYMPCNAIWEPSEVKVRGFRACLSGSSNYQGAFPAYFKSRTGSLNMAGDTPVIGSPAKSLERMQETRHEW